ncbi:MAG TPA: hypothetical protein VFO55_10035 [Gemmatimonadaceae bacterium]|nr:hypothetical protein [Gemmatimonadaceae bacterium]
MKKSKQSVVADVPMGIVIATGGAAPAVPRVRAYYWCDFDADASAEPSADRKAELV